MKTVALGMEELMRADIRGEYRRALTFEVYVDQEGEIPGLVAKGGLVMADSLALG